MSGLRQIRVDSVAPQPWRNGGGSTRTLFTWPGGATPWQLRISVADINQDGPFSAFDGVERWFAVLQGAGVRLALPGAGGRGLTCDSPPLQFAGEAAPACWLTDGPTRDLNLMLQRGSGQALLQDAMPGQPWRHSAPLRGLVTTAALQLRIDDRPAQQVPAWSLVLATSAAAQVWCVDDASPPRPAGARALWLAFTPAAAA
jgi:uncharacterized protein